MSSSYWKNKNTLASILGEPRQTQNYGLRLADFLRDPPVSPPSPDYLRLSELLRQPPAPSPFSDVNALLAAFPFTAPPSPPPTPPLDLAAVLGALQPRPASPPVNVAALLDSFITPPPPVPVFTGSAAADASAESMLFSMSTGLGKTEREKCQRAEIAIRKAIAKDPALSRLPVKVFAQGSYRAETNIGVESDVDVCVLLSGTFHPRYPSGLAHAHFGNRPSSISYARFKDLVEAALKAHFVKGVSRGDKAFDIRENTYRVDADVVAAFEYRWYFAQNDSRFAQGISFETDDSDKLIINYPDYAFMYGDKKNALTNGHYKQVVRILKALRSRMAERGVNAAKDVPSFLIESLVYNVDDAVFRRGRYLAVLHDVLLALYAMTKSDSAAQPMEVNGVKPLFNPMQDWTREQARKFVAACWGYIGYK